MAQPTKTVNSNLNKLATDIFASIESCSLESFRTELNNVLKLENNIEVTEADLKEKLNTYEEQLNKEKQEMKNVQACIKDLEADILKVKEEKNHVYNMKFMKLNRKQDMETKVKLLSSIKMSSKDERKIENMSNLYKMYKHLTNVRWSFTESSETELNGYVFNRQGQFKCFSVPRNPTEEEETIEKMWSLISKSSDWDQAII